MAQEWAQESSPTWRPLGERPFVDPSVPAADFKAVFRNHPAGVALITADPGEGPVALTATSVFSVSADPAMLVFSISSAASASSSILSSDTVVVHLLAADQIALARLGAAKGVDRFADTSLWTRLPTGEPIFHGVRTWVRGRVVDRMTAGDSTVVAVQALQVSFPSEDEPAVAPLVYHNRAWHQLGDHSQLDL